MEMFRVKVESQISSNTVSDLLAGALEGGSNYWMQCATHKQPASWPNTAKEERRFWCNVPINPGGALWIKDLETGRRYSLNAAKIKKGLQKLARERPEVFAQITGDSWDADDADDFLQFCVLGEVLYG